MAMKKKISKEELRRVMSEAKKKHSSIKKIESPLARYNELDQLTCVICKTIVRSEAVWPVHLNSKSHKDNIAMAKKGISVTQQPIISNKRPSEFKEPQAQKKVKGILKNAGASTTAKASLPPDFFEKPAPVTSNQVIPKTSSQNGSAKSLEIKSKEENSTEEKESKDGNPSTLPEGFFDDPKMDAKARHVEYKNPIEEEWEKFQKEIKEETAQSAQIIGDDQEEAATERQLDVIEEQLRNWSRVMDLVKQREQVQTSEKKQDNSDSSSGEEDFDEFLDWRAKKS